ncbi:hypothetical protein HETIRDRAFT_421621 [Heterobasidion irregulare TC 32-1]|uniref:F-box domain-containing protein n=1 Tax=Heterobasidion irregulare (strain TC 32-1) TaxID=747525 RepID=W4JV95_HETIT|nr:uncharacterized protein HETIRDRAFT_421621 [Heterobasidion irregulare TC 32-1]ETW77498.1 hypothetical protein HETIRDRAFT_421621 [Heterobasidion irregulare TC 32-1]
MPAASRHSLRALEFWTQAKNVRISALNNLLASSGSISTTSLFKQIDGKIAALREALSSLREWRNRLPPVSRLPPELLVSIFSLLAADEAPTVRYRISLGWIVVSHVCSHWRRVALDSPVLWANINFDLSSWWIQTMLDRAKQGPLVIRAIRIRYAEDAESVLGVLSSHMSQRRELGLRQPLGGVDTINPVVKFLTSPAPSLEWVKFVVETKKNVHIPNNMFGDYALSLRVVTLVGCTIPWISPIMRNLSHLTIALTQWQYQQVEENYLPSKDDFFDMLANMHHLETLDIEEYFPRYTPDTGVYSRMRQPGIELLDLSSLILRGSWAPCIAVLGSIQIPETSMVHFTCRNHTREGFVDLLLPMLEKHSGKTGKALPLRTLSISVGSLGGSVVVIGRNFSDQKDHFRCKPSILLDLDHLDPNSLSLVANALYIRKLEALWISLRTQDPELYIPIIQVLEKAENWDQVSFHDDALPLFCAMLASTSNSAGDEARMHIDKCFFPNLRSLVLGHETEQPFCGGSLIYQDQLVAALQKRNDLKAHLEELELQLPRNEASKKWVEQLEQLEGIVSVKVFWNGER